MNAALSQFKGQSYLNLETFRKSGAGVKTPIWFVEDGGTFYAITDSKSGKARRIRNNGHTRIAPCKGNGDVLGEWIDAHAQLLVDAEKQRYVNALLRKKYGLWKPIFELYSKIIKRKVAFLQIEPSPA